MRLRMKRHFKSNVSRDGWMVMPIRFSPTMVAFMQMDWVDLPISACRLIEQYDGSFELALRGQQAVSMYDVPQVQQTLLAALDLAQAVEEGSDDIEERAAQVKRLASPL
jgi:hypothetical protein